MLTYKDLFHSIRGSNYFEKTKLLADMFNNKGEKIGRDKK